jgi:hypothetical protein
MTENGGKRLEDFDLPNLCRFFIIEGKSSAAGRRGRRPPACHFFAAG